MGYFRRRSRASIRIADWDAASALPRVGPSVPRLPRYLRFGEAAGAVPFPGIFALAGDALDGDRLEPWARDELRELLEGFNRDLPAPNPGSSGALFFLRSDAQHFVRRLWALARLLQSQGLFIEMTVTRRPGRIVVEDEVQVAAIRTRRRATR